MAKNTNLTQIIKTYLGSSALFAIFGEGSMLYLDNYQGIQGDYFLPLLAAATLPALPPAIGLATRLGQLTEPSRPTRNYGSRRRIAVNGGTRELFMNAVDTVESIFFSPAASTRKVKYKPKPLREFLFDGIVLGGSIGTVDIPEGQLKEFCRKVFHRQVVALHGSGRIRANQIFSRNYFTKQARPSTPAPEYQAMMYILVSRNLVLNRRQGAGGRLRFTPYVTVEEAKGRW